MPHPKTIIPALLLAALLPGVSSAQTATPPNSPTHSILSGPNGRYVFGQVSDYRADQFMLDTQTGRIWQRICVDDPQPKPPAPCQVTRLYPLAYLDESTNAPSRTPGK